MTEWQIVALCLFFAFAGIGTGILLVRRLYIAPIDSRRGKLFDILMGPLPEREPEGDVSIMSGPKPRFRF